MLYNFQTMFVVAIILVAFSKSMFSKSFLGGATFCILLMSGLMSSFYPELLNSQQNTNSLFALSKYSLESTLFLVAGFFIIYGLSMNNLKSLMKLISFIAIVNSVWIIGKKILGMPATGIMLNTSMEGTFLSIMFAYILHKGPFKVSQNKILLILGTVIIATICTTSSMGVFGIILSLTAHRLWARHLLRTHMFIIVIIFISALAVIGDKLFSDSLRFVAWTWSFEWWLPNANKFFGTGLGTFWGLGPWIQDTGVAKNCTALSSDAVCESAKFAYQYKNYYTFMHNDFLQMVFETGALGLGTFITFIITSWRRIWDNTWLLPVFAVFSFNAFFNMPFHYPITAIIGIIIFRYCTEESKDEYSYL